MINKRVLAAAAVVIAVTAAASPAIAKGGGTGGGGTGGGGTGGGGGGGGGTTTALTTPAIAPGTFDGIGPGPVYVHDSFGAGDLTRYQQDGKVVDVLRHPEIGGLRAEYGNNKTETWISASAASGGPVWHLVFGGTSSPDVYEPYTPLQESSEPAIGYGDGVLFMVGEPGAPDTRPDALLPFPAPTDSPSTVSGEIVNFNGKTAIGFTSSSATTRNFETDGQAWLELDSTAFFSDGDGIARWTFHTGGLSGTTLNGTFTLDNFNMNRAAVSYDPVTHTAAAKVNGEVVASVPYTAQPIRYAGVEGTFNGNVNNFSVWRGTVTDPMPDSIAAPATPATSRR